MSHPAAADRPDPEAPVLVERVGSLGRIRLNRPQALNSLTLPMIRAIALGLERCERDPAIVAILLTGEGGRALCAGGDVRAIHDAGRSGDPMPMEFWRAEYRLNARIDACPKPYLAFMDGIVMGGGVGLSAHGHRRLTTERTRLAMPETGIGYFPDVGGTWLLAHAPGEVGTYLGLTGATIGAADAIHAGLADLHLPAACLPELVARLAELPMGADDAALDHLLAAFATDPGPAPLAAHRAAIDAAFAGDAVEAILAALGRQDSAFAQATLDMLAQRSPTSLKLTLRLLRLGRASPDLATCLERELRADRQILQGHDFYEGVRAALIDKDRNPRWSPATLAEVHTALIDAYLAGPPERLDLA
ncbi:MAG: enoyl-CoA hydratase/isomerase family protein [Geminicoccaceae bacterium]